MGNVSGGEMGVFVVLFAVFALEGALFSLDPNHQNQIWTPSSALASVQPPPAVEGTCNWTWWNPATYFCTVTSTANSILFAAQGFVYFFAQVFAVVAEPISMIIVIAGYSVLYGGILAWFNGVAAAVMAAIFIHGLI